MTNNDNQEAVPFSAPEFDEQALEGVTGAGPFSKFVNSVKGCFGCGTKMPEKVPATRQEMAIQAGLVETAPGKYYVPPSTQGAFSGSAR
jgi:hypothetical protein